MSDCCDPAREVTPASACPSCAARAAGVGIATVEALMTPAALGRLHPGRFHVCASPACDIVYFSDDGQIFRTGDVRVAVWQKQPPGARRLCYCFGENETDMRHEIDHAGRTLAVERVRRQIAEGRCACELRNPRGVCCLGDLMAAVSRISASRRADPADAC
jgi:hypothetical protein